MTRSTSSSLLAVRAEARGLSDAHNTTTSWCRSRATSATSEPVLPRPRMRIFMRLKILTAKFAKRSRRGRKEHFFANFAKALRALRLNAFECGQRPPRGLCKHICIQIGEERFVQPPYNFRHCVLFDHEGQIDLRSPLRNHAYLHIRQFAEHAGRDPRRLPQIFPHQA